MGTPMTEQLPVERLPVRRRRGGPHPTSGEALRARVLAERPRIARASRIRELVLGFQDGLLVPLAVVTGLAGADAASSTVLVGGLAEAGAGALAMGTGAYLASQAENQLFAHEIAAEEEEPTAATCAVFQAGPTSRTRHRVFLSGPSASTRAGWRSRSAQLGSGVIVPSRATAPKWRLSSVSTLPPLRSAQAITAASENPSGRSA